MFVFLQTQLKLTISQIEYLSSTADVGFVREVEEKSFDLLYPMELEEQWWTGQLAVDIHQALRNKEVKLTPYKSQSPQLNLRRYFADLLAIVSNHFCLCPTTRHLAVYLLDLFMDRCNISVQQLHVVALSCLLLASKFEEKEERVPKLEQLNTLGCMTSMNLMLSKQNLLHMELLLLETFQWNLCLPTAAHFIDYYLTAAAHASDFHDGWPMVCLEKTKVYMDKYSDYFLQVSLQDHGFLNFPPSLVAAACIASSRTVIRLSPFWPTRLQYLTDYTWDSLLLCIEHLLIAHDSDVKEASKQNNQMQVQQSSQTSFSIHSATSPQAQIEQYASTSTAVFSPTVQTTELPVFNNSGTRVHVANILFQYTSQYNNLWTFSG